MELICAQCGELHRFGERIRCVRCPCGNVIYGDCSQLISAVSTAPDESTGGLPIWVKLIKRFAKPSDKGVGDTVQRIAAKFGGDRFKAFAEKIGMPCGCTDRQHAWNEAFPY